MENKIVIDKSIDRGTFQPIVDVWVNDKKIMKLYVEALQDSMLTSNTDILEDIFNVLRNKI